MVPILKMRRFSCLLRLSLPPGMGEMAQTFISEIEWLAYSIKMSRNRLVNIILPYGTKVFSKSDRLTSACFTDVKFATFTARNPVNDVGGGACKIVPNNEIGIRSRNGCGRVEERQQILSNWAPHIKLSRMFLLRLKELRGLSVKMADVSGSF